MKSFIGLLCFAASASAFADSSRNCTNVEQVKAKAEQEVVAPFQRTGNVVCVTNSVKFSAGDAVRDSYQLTYACKGTSAGAKVVLLKVSFRDSQLRLFNCSELNDLAVSTFIEQTDREF